MASVPPRRPAGPAAPLLPVVLAALLAAACGEGSPEGGGEPEVPDVTWADDVAPIVYAECAGCHREGSIAPFPLTSYEDAAPAADLLAAVTVAREMPPMGVDNTGACNTYRDARWLTDEEITVFDAWARAGAPAGDLSRAPSAPPPPPGLDRVDAELAMAEAYTPPSDRTDDYRCFVVDLDGAAGRWLTGYEVVPGEPRTVHHVIVYSLPTDAARDAARAREEATPGPGYTCFGASGVFPSDPLAVWAPGTGPVRFPEGTGVQVPGDAAVVQVHYNLLADGALPDRTSVRLRLADAVAEPAVFALMPHFGLSLPPREARVETGTSISIPANARVWGGIPHMHELGRELRASVVRGDADAQEEQCLVDVFDWDFGWQGLWFFDEPIDVSAGDRLDLTCVYDTRSRADTTTWGDGTQDEMCLVYLFASAR